MSNSGIPTFYRTVSGSKLTETLAASVQAIKDEDGLTDKELGQFLGKGLDAGKAYRTGYAEMGFIAFLRGIERWNGRFASDVLEKIGFKLTPIHREPVSDQSLQTRLAKLMVEVSIALEDGKIDEIEIARMKRTLIEAGEAIDSYRGRASA